MLLSEVLFSRDKKFLAKKSFSFEVSLLANLSESQCHTTCATFLSLLKAGHVPCYLNKIKRNEAM